MSTRKERQKEHSDLMRATIATVVQPAIESILKPIGDYVSKKEKKEKKIQIDLLLARVRVSLESEVIKQNNIHIKKLCHPPASNICHSPEKDMVSILKNADYRDDNWKSYFGPRKKEELCINKKLEVYVEIKCVLCDKILYDLGGQFCLPKNKKNKKNQ